MTSAGRQCLSAPMFHPAAVGPPFAPAHYGARTIRVLPKWRNRRAGSWRGGTSSGGDGAWFYESSCGNSIGPRFEVPPAIFSVPFHRPDLRLRDLPEPVRFPFLRRARARLRLPAPCFEYQGSAATCNPLTPVRLRHKKTRTIHSCGLGKFPFDSVAEAQTSRESPGL